MSEQLEANPAPSDEATLADVQEAKTLDTGAEAQADNEDGDEADDELEKLIGEATGDGEAELVEVEFEGMKFMVPKGAEGGYLRQSDYTKKTMSLAEERKAVEAAKAQAEQIGALGKEAREALVQSAALQLRLQELENTPIDGMSQEQVNALRLDHADISRRISELDRRGQEATQREREARSQQYAKAVEEAFSKAKTTIKDLDSRRPQIDEFLASIGEDPAGVTSTIDNPKIWEVLHYADIGKRFTERQRKAASVKAAQQASPATTVGGRKAGAAFDPETASPEQYHAWRTKQRAG